MVNVLKHTIAWYVIPICRCPDQPSCDVQMRRVYIQFACTEVANINALMPRGTGALLILQPCAVVKL